MLSQIYTAVGLCFVLQIFQSDRLRKGRGSENIKHTSSYSQKSNKYMLNMYISFFIHSISFAFASMHCLRFVFVFVLNLNAGNVCV